MYFTGKTESQVGSALALASAALPERKASGSHPLPLPSCCCFQSVFVRIVLQCGAQTHVHGLLGINVESVEAGWVSSFTHCCDKALKRKQGGSVTV